MKIDEHQQETLEEMPVSAEPSAGEQVSLVLEDVRALVRAELRYYQSRLDYSRYVMKWSFRFGAVAAFAFGAAAIGLVTGLVMTLAPLIGPGWATLVVTLGFILIGAIAGYQARTWVRKVYFPEVEASDDDIPKRPSTDGT
jgi:Putative Actinobacterial Holin-X, holin superfamily III